MLGLSRTLGELYTVFYNGPKCGASAPDHLHFQAGLRSFLPLDTEYDAIKGEQATLPFQVAGGLCRRKLPSLLHFA
jgi:hypothetical protein